MLMQTHEPLENKNVLIVTLYRLPLQMYVFGVCLFSRFWTNLSLELLMSITFFNTTIMLNVNEWNKKINSALDRRKTQIRFFQEVQKFFRVV